MQPIVLTDRDVELMRAVHRHRFLRSTHLVELAGGGPQAVLRRLQRLFHHGYLDRPVVQLDWYTRGSEPLVYALARRGAAVLAAAGEMRRGARIRWETKNRSVSRVFLHHTLAVADVMAAFEIACRDNAAVDFIGPDEALARTREARPRLRRRFRWQVDVRLEGKLHRLGVEPDKAFGLRLKDQAGNAREAFFFLEADRGTMPVVRKDLAQTSFFRKLLAYRETWRQGIYRSLLGLPNFRVLVVTANKQRESHLLAASHRIGPTRSRLVLFADQRGFASSNPLTLNWRTHDGDLVALSSDQTSKSRGSAR